MSSGPFYPRDDPRRWERKHWRDAQGIVHRLRNGQMMLSPTCGVVFVLEEEGQMLKVMGPVENTVPVTCMACLANEGQ